MENLKGQQMVSPNYVALSNSAIILAFIGSRLAGRPVAMLPGTI
jgi:hypothetical protein